MDGIIGEQSNSFEFESEMVYGKRHLNILKYDTTKYDFATLVQNIFNVDDLSLLHEDQKQKYGVFTEFGKDNNTEFHNAFYQTLNSDQGANIKALFTDFVKKIILPYLELDEAMVQAFPTFRIQLPNNVAVAQPHHDHQLGHPIGEVNFSIALTKMWGSNTIWIEKMPRSENYVEMNLEPNNCINFNGNLCRHYNNINETGKTRISMDFRVLPMNYYFPEKSVNSLTTKQKFVEGGYYAHLKK